MHAVESVGSLAAEGAIAWHHENSHSGLQPVSSRIYSQRTDGDQIQKAQNKKRTIKTGTMKMNENKKEWFEFDTNRSFEERCEIVRRTEITEDMTYEERLAMQKARYGL